MLQRFGVGALALPRRQEYVVNSHRVPLVWEAAMGKHIQMGGPCNRIFRSRNGREDSKAVMPVGRRARFANL